MRTARLLTIIDLYGQTSHEETHHSNLDSIKEIVTNLKNRRDYISLKYVIDNELKNVHSLTNVDKQYLYWHEAIYIYYLETEAKNRFCLIFLIVLALS